MTKSIQYAKYDGLIKDIKKKRRKASIIFVCAVILSVIVCLPIHIEIPSIISFNSTGLGIGTAIVLVAVCFLLYFLAIGNIFHPVYYSLTEEGDPEKYIVLNSAFFKGSMLNSVYASGLSLLGDFDEALPYANLLIESGKKAMILSGYHCKLRCEFYKGEYDLAKSTAEKYAELLKSGKRHNSKLTAFHEKLLTVNKFMIAILEKDAETQKSLYDALSPWSKSVVLHGFINYLKGVSAFDSGNTEEAFYRFKCVTESCDKTILATYSKDYLAKIKEKSNI